VDDKPRLLFKDAATSLELISLSPTYWQTMLAQLGRHANSASGVIIARCGKGSIVFAGDSTIEQWRAIESKLGRAIICDLLAVSHHGGINWAQNANVSADLEWLYSKGVVAQTAVVSVGTQNSHKHPRPAVMSALMQHCGSVLCTQITTQCCQNLESLRPGVRSPDAASRSSTKVAKTRSGKSRDVACAGTVIAELAASGVVVSRLKDHADGVNQLVANSHSPLCR